MRVICEYCDNSVEINDNMTCPCCGGSLGEAATAAMEQMRQEELELERARLKNEERRLKAEAAESDNQRWGKIFSVWSGIKNFFARLFHGIGGLLKIAVIVLIVLAVVYIFRKYFM